MDDIIDRYKQDVDRGLLREALKLTPTERLRRLVELTRFAAADCRESVQEGGSVTDFERLLQALAAGSVEYILIGGLPPTLTGRFERPATSNRVCTVAGQPRAAREDTRASATVLRGAPPGLPF